MAAVDSKPRSDEPNARGTLGTAIAIFVGVGAVIAMLSIGAAFALLVVAKHVGGTSLAWLCAWYVLGTLGEALISPLGMDFVTSLVPRRLSAVAMSLWLLAMSAGGKLAGLASPNTIGLTMGACLAAAAWFFVAERPRRAAVAVAEEATT